MKNEGAALLAPGWRVSLTGGLVSRLQGRDAVAPGTVGRALATASMARPVAALPAELEDLMKKAAVMQLVGSSSWVLTDDEMWELLWARQRR